MRIALILPGFSAHAHDWAIPALQHLAHELAQRHDVHIFSLRYPTKGLYHFNGLTHHAIGGGNNYGLKRGWIINKSIRFIWQQHQQTPFDIFHAFWADEPGLVAMCIAKLLNRPCLVSLGGWELSNLPHINYGAQRITIHRWLIRHVLRHANGVTAGSAYQLNLAHQHGVSPHKLHFASLGVDILHFRPARQPLSLTQPTLIQVASLLPVKNQAVLLQTLHLVKRAIPHIHVHLVGTGPLENELKLLAQQLNITENITWHQHVAHLELPARYHQAHLYIQSSWHESQGMAVLEAMACGLPVIGTPVGIMPEVACLPPTFIATQLAAQIIAIFTNPDFYQTASQKARHVVTSNFNLVAATRTFETLYQSLNRT